MPRTAIAQLAKLIGQELESGAGPSERRRGRVPGSDIIMSALTAICALAHGTRSLWKKLAGRLR